ncbi:hypothetical protein TcG_07991 [Trypanosoma cruzi]|uniref:Cux N-terminal domain-containing protein n=1 Tax=Trypanosoma cruzi Dm28c TaxID=1416333 RepID=V5BGV6_TRYCR|nr:hypothetical protein TCDM_08453 [Trypanosoma cruzi Dm28c]PBJ78317.1 hypothetical protein BCY84_04822 [Trypanosoma cruzi cruzi]RNF14049.1 hypothetical protein TcG_07991 [Trypanosoma cruzi]
MDGNTVLLRWEEQYFSLCEITSKWRKVHLSSLQGNAPYDRILSQHENLKAYREKVRNLTKVFSQLNNEEKLNGFVALLKEYQSYIDKLTSYLKNTERSYIEFFNRVKDITDPYPFMEKFCGEMERMLKDVERMHAYKALEKEVHLLQTEMVGLRGQEVTKGSLRRQFAEFERNAIRHAEQSGKDVTAEYQTLLSQSPQWKYELQKEVQSIQYEIRKRDKTIKDLKNHVMELCTSVEEVEAQQGRDMARFTMELEASQSNLLKKEAELQRLLVCRDHDSHANCTECVSIAALDASSQVFVDCKGVNANSNPNEGKKIPFFQKDAEHDAAMWEEEKLEMKQQEEALRKELFELRLKYDELCTVNDNQRRQKEESLQLKMVRTGELQHRIASINVYVDQLKAEKEQLVRAVQSLDRVLSNYPTNSSISTLNDKASSQRGEMASTEVSLTKGGERKELELLEKDGYSFERLLASSAMWQGGVNALDEENGEQNNAVSASQLSLPQESKKDPFLIVTFQRDKLRERLLTLNEVISPQLQSMKSEVVTLFSENFALRQRMAGYAGGNAHPGNDCASIYGFPMLGSMEKDDGLQPKVGIPWLVDPVAGVIPCRTVLNVLDYGAGAFSLHVFSTTFGRRLLFMYMVVLHVYLVYLFFL